MSPVPFRTAWRRFAALWSAPRGAAAAGLLCALIGATVLAAWMTDLTRLLQLRPGWPIMQFNTALVFTTAGLGLAALARGRRIAPAVLGALTSGFGSLILGQAMSGNDLGIDRLLFAPVLVDPFSAPGRTSNPTAVGFLLAGTFLLLSSYSWTGKPRSWVLAALATALLALPVHALVGHLGGEIAAREYALVRGMSLPTALAFLILALGEVTLVWGESERVGFAPDWLPLLAGVPGVVLTLSVATTVDLKDRLAFEREVRREARIAADRVETLIERPIQAVVRMAERWEARGAVPEPEWRRDAETYVRDFPAILSLARVDADSIVRSIVPADAHPSPLGSRAQPDPSRPSNPLQPPLRAAGGDLAALLYYSDVPLVSNGRRHGYVRIVFRMPEALDRRTAELWGAGFSFAIRDPDREVYARIQSRREHERDWGQSAPMRIGGEDWSLRLWPGPALLSARRSGVPAALLWSGLAISLLASLLVHLLRRSILHGQQLEAARARLADSLQALEQATAQLKLSEERFRKVFDDGPLGMTMTSLDLRLTHVNAQFCRMLGYRESELLHLTFKDFTHPEDRDRKTDLVEQLRRGEIPILRLENRYLRKDGSIMRGSQTAVVVRDAQGQPQFFLAMVEDITARHEAEAALRASEERFRRVVESLPNALVIVDRQGTIRQVNPRASAWFGYAPEEMVGQPVEMLMPSSVRTGHVQRRQAYLTAPSARAMGTGLDLRAQRKDGSTFPVDVSLSPMQTERGTEVIASIVDITESREAQLALSNLNRELSATNRELESFAYSVSHDLRQPLRGVTGFCKMLEEDFGDKLESEARRYIKTIVASAERMGSLIDDLLKLSRISREQMVFEPVDLSALSRDVVNELHSADPARQVEIDIEEGLTARGDPRLVRVLLHNLIGNAWKFTSKTGNARIAVGRRSKDGWNAFCVEDNGAGFNMKYADKLFGPFQRLHRATEYDGTGIGLATAQRIVNRHGGRIWAEAAEGQGAAFYFTW